MSKFFGYYPVAQARAWLAGRSTVEPCDLTALKYYLWTAHEDALTGDGIFCKIYVAFS